MAKLRKNQRVVGVRLMPAGTKMHNRRPVIGVREVAANLAVDRNQPVLQADELADDGSAVYNEQPVLGAVLVTDGRAIYNDQPVLPFAGALGWWRQEEHRLDGIAPGFFIDVLNDRYALAGRRCAITDLLTLANASAIRTYVDKDGIVRTAEPNTLRLSYREGVRTLLLEGAATNILPRSMAIHLAPWAPNFAPNITGNTGVLAPNGTQTATKIESSTAQSGQYQSFDVASGTTRTFSVYIKRISGAGMLQIGCAITPTQARVNIDLTTMTITSAHADVIASGREVIGDGWVRFWGAYVTTGPRNSFFIYSNDTNPKSFAAWGAQNEVGAFPSSFIPTGTTAVTRPADTCLFTALAASVLQGTGGAIAYRAFVPTGTPTQVFVGHSSNIALLRSATGAPASLLLDGTLTSTTTLRADALPGELRTAVSWGPAGRIGSDNGNAPAASAMPLGYPMTAPSVGRNTSLDPQNVYHIRQLVGWTLPDRASSAGIQAQARAAT